MSRVTAETITDEQIREVLMIDDDEAFAVALLALDGSLFSKKTKEARARCAEILNARSAK